jgi:hypothetical protein
MKRTILVKLVLTSTLVIVGAVAAAYWNEARKEVVYLCGNFSKGVSQDSVLRQLDTGNLLQYQLETISTGSRIIADSRLNLRRYKCIVEFDPEGKVLSAEIQ